MGKNKKDSSAVDEIKEKVDKLNEEIEQIEEVNEIDQTTPLTPPVFEEPATTYANLTPPVINVKSERARSIFSRFGGLGLFLLTLAVVGVLSFLVVRAARNNDDGNTVASEQTNESTDDSTVIEGRNDSVSGIEDDEGEDSTSNDSDSFEVDGVNVTIGNSSDEDDSGDNDDSEDDKVVAIIGADDEGDNDKTVSQDNEDEDREDSEVGGVLGSSVGGVPSTGVTNELPNTGAEDFMLFVAAIIFATTFAIVHTRQLNSEV